MSASWPKHLAQRMLRISSDRPTKSGHKNRSQPAKTKRIASRSHAYRAGTIPDDALSTPRPSILRVIGISPNARLETSSRGCGSSSRYRRADDRAPGEIYMAEKYDPVELNNVLSLAAADRSMRGRALLFKRRRLNPSRWRVRPSMRKLLNWPRRMANTGWPSISTDHCSRNSVYWRAKLVRR